MSASGDPSERRNIFETIFEIVGESKTLTAFNGTPETVQLTGESSPPTIAAEIPNTSSHESSEPPSKSFYTSTQLSEILGDLPPGSFERAKNLCMNQRYPPGLAASMEREKTADSEYEASGRSLARRKKKPRTSSGPFLEVSQRHFEGTFLAKCSSENTPEPSNLEPSEYRENSFIGTDSGNVTDSRHLGAEIDFGSDRDSSDYEILEVIPPRSPHLLSLKPEPDSNEKREDSFASGGLDPTEGLNIKSETQSSFIPPGIQDVKSELQLSASAAGTPAPEGPHGPPQDDLQQVEVQGRKRKLDAAAPRVPGSRSACPTAATPIPSASALLSQRRRTQAPEAPQSSPAKDARKMDEYALQFFDKMILESIRYADAFSQRLIQTKIDVAPAHRMAVLSVSSEFYVPKPCRYCAPHVVRIEAESGRLRPEKFLLVGDALRVYMLASQVTRSMIDVNIAPELLDLCKSHIQVAHVTSVQFETPDGLLKVPEEWYELVESKIVEPKDHFHWLPLIMPSSMERAEDLFHTIVIAATTRHTIITLSWTAVLPAVELANTARNVASDFCPPTLSIQSVEVTQSRVLRNFITSVWTTSNEDLTPANSTGVKLLVDMLPRELREFTLTLDKRVNVIGLSGIGLMCLTFKRLFAHLFLSDSRVPHRNLTSVLQCLNLLECLEDKKLYQYDSFSLLTSLHETLQKSWNAVLMARVGAVSGASYLTFMKRISYRTAGVLSEADQQRARLFESTMVARQVVMESITSALFPALLDLKKALSEMSHYFATVSSRDPGFMVGRNSTAFRLLQRGRSNLEELKNPASFEGDNAATRAGFTHAWLRTAVERCDEKYKLISPTLYYWLSHLSKQPIEFARWLQDTGRVVMKIWSRSFGNSVNDDIIAVVIKGLFRRLLFLFETMEAWIRAVHNSVLLQYAQDMSRLLQEELADELGNVNLNTLATGSWVRLQVASCSSNSDDVEVPRRLISLPLIPSDVKMFYELVASQFESRPRTAVVVAGLADKEVEITAQVSSHEPRPETVSGPPRPTNDLLLSMKPDPGAETPRAVPRPPPKKVMVHVGQEEASGASTTVEVVSSPETPRRDPSVEADLDRRELAKLKRSEKIRAASSVSGSSRKS